MTAVYVLRLVICSNSNKLMGLLYHSMNIQFVHAICNVNLFGMSVLIALNVHNNSISLRLSLMRFDTWHQMQNIGSLRQPSTIKGQALMRLNKVFAYAAPSVSPDFSKKKFTWSHPLNSKTWVKTERKTVWEKSGNWSSTYRNNHMFLKINHNNSCSSRCSILFRFNPYI